MTDPGDWTKIENVFTEIQRLNSDRPLTEGEKELIRGQRQINRRFFNVLNDILENLSPTQGASTAKTLAEIKLELQKVPGERPPGCASEPEG